MGEVHYPIRVLIVDDSAFMRKALSRMLGDSSDVTVIGTAKNGEDALRKIEEMKPDVMTLDIEMPGMNGLAVIERVMAVTPLPIIVVSALTEAGADVTLQALEMGAVDFIPKHLEGDSLRISAIQRPLLEKIKAAGQAAPKMRSSWTQSTGDQPYGSNRRWSLTEQKGPWGPMVFGKNGSPRTIVPCEPREGGQDRKQFPFLAIGCSTGGPQALQELLPRFPASFPAGIVIVQHMPKFFTKPFAGRLNQLCQIEVREAGEHDTVSPGLALLAPGGQHLSLVKRGDGHIVVHLSESPADLPYRPSVDVMMKSAAKIFGPRLVGIIMTGMGHDGVEGARAIKSAQGWTIAQDEGSSIIYGMPKAVVEHGCADQVLPLSDIAEETISYFHHMMDTKGHFSTGPIVPA